MKNYIIILVLIFSTPILNAQIEPYQMVKKMGRGINLGNVLSAPVEGNWSPIVMQQYFTDVAAAGFTNVRIPMDFFGVRTTGDTSVYSDTAGTSDSYTGTSADYVLNAAYLDRVEEVIDWGLSAGLIVSLDFHGADLKSEFLNRFHTTNTEYTDPTSARRVADNQKFRVIWTQIADLFKNHSEDLLFEIINEPYFEMSKAEMNTLNTDILAIIRGSGGSNETRNVIITGGGANSHEAPLQIAASIITNDNYLIATFHYYQPFNFTSSSADSRDIESWGSTSDKNTLSARFEEVLTWSNSNNIPVFVGEFGADNTGGYKYSTGDLNTIGGNATGYADGGPDNASRVEFHRYIAEQSINRGFSFSVWDAGPKSNKTIHMRQDSPSSLNYNIANFSVNTYNPKSTNVSAVLDTSTWVEDVKNALFSSGTWPLCYGPSTNSLVLNPDFECGFDTNWSFNVSGATAAAIYSDATTEAKNGLVGAKIDVTTKDVYNKVILSNETYIKDLTGKKITVKAFAKSVALSGQSFKIRVKSVVNGNNSYVSSSAFNLTNSYFENPFEFEYIVPNNTSSVQVQVLFGEFSGTYFLDSFETVIEDNKTIWSGVTNTDWSTNSNWSNGVPTNSLDAAIPSGLAKYPVISATIGATVYNLEVFAGASLIISSGGSLIVSGTSLGNITYNVNVADTNWHLVASPLVGTVYNHTWIDENDIASGTDFSSNRGISTYDNTSSRTPAIVGEAGHWRYHQALSSRTFGTGVGYALVKETNSGVSAGNYTFTGTIVSNFNPSVSQGLNNWNLIGNSFPSYLDVDAFVTLNTANLGGLFQAIYVWNGSAYVVKTADYIFPGQAFFVSSNVSSGTVSVTAAMQSHQTTTTFLKSSNTDTSIKLNITDGTSNKVTKINYLEGKTKGIDPGFDIGMFNGVSSDLRIFTHLLDNNDGTAIARQALPNSDLESMVIPVGVKAAAGKEITFTAEALYLPDDIKVFLEDRLTNTFTGLDEANTKYEITLSENLNGVGRFYIHTSAKGALSIDNAILETVRIHKLNNSTLRITGLPHVKASVNLFNLLGKQMMYTSFDTTTFKDLSLPNLAAGIYIVQLTTESGKLNKKIILE